MPQNLYISIIQKNDNNQFATGYMVNPTLHVNKVFREQVDNRLGKKFNQNTMTGVRNFLKE